MNDAVKVENLLPTYERAITALEIRGQVNLIQEVLTGVMKPGVHYGFPPGTEPKTEEEKKTKKPSLYKPGAELLCTVFRFDPQYEAVRTRHGNHLEVVSTCTLYYIPNGRRIGSGMGSATTEESKHAYRWASRVCPQCNAAAIIKGREEYGGGWLCFGRKGGCGAKFTDGDSAIEGQEAGRVANPDLADQHNTVLKIGNKRALVAAVLTATAASDMFHQDLEDIGPEAEFHDGATGAQTAEQKAPVKGAGKKNERQSSKADTEMLTDGAKKTLRDALARGKRAEPDLVAAGFPKIDQMPFGRFNEAMEWVKKNPAA